MKRMGSVWIVLLGAAATSCGQPGSQSYLAVSEPHILAKKCRNDKTRPTTLSYLKTNSWIRITYDRNPCKSSQSGFGLQDGDTGNIVVIPYASQGDQRIPTNVNTIVAAEEQRGNYAIPLANPQPGDASRAIADFARDNPGVRDVGRVDIAIHGHGGAITRDEGTPFRPTSDTIIGDSYYPPNPPNGVERVDVQTPRSSDFSARDITAETLGSLRQNGLAGAGTTCNLYVGSCQAGGVINGIRDDWEAWDRMGLDSAIGASRADQSSFDGPVNGRASELLLNTLYTARENPPPGLDGNGDGVVTQAEFRRQYPGAQNTFASGSVIGSDLIPPSTNSQIRNSAQPVGRDPVTNETWYQPTTTTSQDFEFAGNENTPLFSVPTGN